MNVYVNSPYKTSLSSYNYSPYLNSYLYEREKEQLNSIDNIQKERIENTNKISELELQKYQVTRQNDIKLNELTLNKSFQLDESDKKIVELEKNLEITNMNKRRNSVELETAVSNHQNSNLKSYYSP
jgi:hypothetical protein